MSDSNKTLKCIQVLLCHTEGEAYSTNGKYHLTLDKEDNVVVTEVSSGSVITDDDTMQRIIDGYSDISVFPFDTDGVKIESTICEQDILVTSEKLNGVYVCDISDDAEDLDLGTVVIDLDNGIMVGYNETDEECIDIMYNILKLY